MNNTISMIIKDIVRHLSTIVADETLPLLERHIKTDEMQIKYMDKVLFTLDNLQDVYIISQIRGMAIKHLNELRAGNIV